MFRSALKQSSGPVRELLGEIAPAPESASLAVLQEENGLYHRRLNEFNSQRLDGSLEAQQELMDKLATGEADIDGDGVVSLVEFLVAGGTSDMFTEMDLDGSGFIDQVEISIAQRKALN